MSDEKVNHPAHYGGGDNPFEAIKVIESWALGFHLGNALKYVLRAGKKGTPLAEDLAKAAWYLERAQQHGVPPVRLFMPMERSEPLLDWEAVAQAHGLSPDLSEVVHRILKGSLSLALDALTRARFT